MFSDGRVWPTVQVREAWRDGLDVIALTDHAEYHPNAPDVRVDGNRAYEVAKPIAAQLGILLIRGVEITKPDPPAPSVLPDGSAHFNALFISDANALNTPDLMQSLRAAKAQHAFVFWNHPRYGVDACRMVPPDRARVRRRAVPGDGAGERPRFLRGSLPVDRRATS